MAWIKAAVRLVRVVVVLACVAKVTKASRGRKLAPAGGSDDPWSAGPPAGSAPAADDEPPFG